MITLKTSTRSNRTERVETLALQNIKTRHRRAASSFRSWDRRAGEVDAAESDRLLDKPTSGS